MTQVDARTLYKDVYCGRGELENRIWEHQPMLFADRTSAAARESAPALLLVGGLRPAGRASSARARRDRAGAYPVHHDLTLDETGFAGANDDVKHVAAHGAGERV
jgi:hypothetical protein